MDTHERLRQLLNERGWTEYRLAKNCGLSESRLRIFIGGIQSPHSQRWKQSVRDSASQWRSSFAEGEMVEINPELKELFEKLGQPHAGTKESGEPDAESH